MEHRVVMWKLLAKSVQGSGHKRLGTVCQDACLANLHSIGDQSVLVLAAADGAGSADHSNVGAQVSCQIIQSLVAQHLEDQPDLIPIERYQAIAWYERVRTELDREASELSVPVRQLACTLLLAIISETGAAFCQIGDGAIVIRDAADLRPVFWPQSGEYANTTNFVTSGRIEHDLNFEWLSGPIDDVAMFTDGLQSVALNFATQQAHQPFFAPLLDSLRKHPNPSELDGPMQSFLESKSLAERTDDDLTLILATRITE